MSDIVARLEVISQETGCMLDLTTILSTSVCPKVDIKTQPHHHIEDGGDYICVTPTDGHHKRTDESDDCYKVDPQVCDQNTVAMDLELLILLGLLTELELEQYLQQMGAMPQGGQLTNMGPDSGTTPTNGGNGNGNGNGGTTGTSPSGGMPTNVMMNPLLSLTAGQMGELANLNVGGKNGLLNLDVGKNGQLLGLDLDGKPLLTLRRRADKILGLQVGGPTETDGDINVNLLTNGATTTGSSSGTSPTGSSSTGTGNGNGSGNSGNGGNSYSNGGNGNGSGSDISNEAGQFLSWFQPICSQGFSPEHRSQGTQCHANDVNHCLAICHAQSALQSIGQGQGQGQEGYGKRSSEEILVCSAVEFNDSTADDNCLYIVAPESEPCQESELEPNDNCYTFFRN